MEKINKRMAAAKIKKIQGSNLLVLDIIACIKVKIDDIDEPVEVVVPVSWKRAKRMAIAKIKIKKITQDQLPTKVEAVLSSRI